MAIDTEYSSSTLKVSQEERASLETSLADIGKQYRTVATKLNARNIAVALPEELLIIIFKHHIALCFQNIASDKYTGLEEIVDNNRDVYGWIDVTHVCERWRDVALRAPALWTRLRVGKLAAVRAFLERSRSLPVDVEGAMSKRISKDMSRAWTLVFKQSHRIRSLKFGYLNSVFSDFYEWAPRISPAFPILKTLLLDADCNGNPDAVPAILQILTKGPTIETLRTSNLAFPAARSLFSSYLRHLDLQAVTNVKANSALWYWEQLFMALKSVPQLCTLRVIDSIPSPYHLAPTPFNISGLPFLLKEPIQLPQLSLLQVDCSENAGFPTIFICNLSLPGSCSLRLSTYTSVEAYNPLLGSLFATKVSAAHQASPPTPLQTLVVSVYHDGEPLVHRPIAVAGWSQNLPILSEHRLSSFPASYTSIPCLFEVCVWDASETGVLEDIVEPIPMHSVQTLSLGFDRPVLDTDIPSATCLKRTFAPATGVSTLVIQGAWATRLSATLEPRSNGSMLFPALDTLYLCEVNFPPGKELVPWAEHRAVCEGWRRELTDVLQLREQLRGGQKMKRIIVRNSGDLKEVDVDALRPYADEVTWDRSRGYDITNWGWGWPQFDYDYGDAEETLAVDVVDQ